MTARAAAPSEVKDSASAADDCGMRAPLGFLLLCATSVALAAGAAGAGPAAARAAAGTGFADAYYSRTAAVPQARSPLGMRSYLSSNQPQMEMQSQLIFGNLIGAGGSFNSFVSMIQRQDGWALKSKGVPVVMVSGSFADMKVLESFLGGVYHKPEDELTDAMPLGGAAEDADLHIALGRYFANIVTWAGK